MNQPIGFFDSGVGGLSLLPAFKELLPNEALCYIADDAFSPYGKKNKRDILDRARKLTRVLLEHQCKIIVLACNTATTQVIDELRHEFPLPFIGIEPAIKPAVLATQTGVVGVLATHGTLNSGLFHQSSLRHAANISIIEQIGEGLVEIVEKGIIDHPSTKALLTHYLKPMLDKGMDTLVLGCTHYPFLIPTMRKILPKGITIVDNSIAIALQTKKVLIQKKLLNSHNDHGTERYYSTAKKSNLGFYLKENIIHLPL